MGRLTGDMTRLVGEIHAARGERGRFLRDLTHARVEMRRAVAALRKRFLDDLAGARVAWFGPAPVSPGAAGAGAAAAGAREMDTASRGVAGGGGGTPAPDESLRSRRTRGRR